MEYWMHPSNNVRTLVRNAGAGASVNYSGPMSFLEHQPCAYQSSSGFQSDASAVVLPFFNDVEAPMNTAVANSTGWAAKEEWTKREADIRQLYVHEKKTLKEVKRLMETRHGFRATDKMYKTHIKQWGLDKKNKEPEMRAVVRKHKQRADQGKPSTIHIRGQIRTMAEVLHYLERKGVSIDEIIARRTSSPTPEAVKFFTPGPSPILTPQVLAVPEVMFRSIRDYIKASFDSGTWHGADLLIECRSTKDEDDANNEWGDFIDECYLAFSLSQRKLSYEAEQTLSKAITRIKQILLAELPATLTELLRLFAYLRSQEEAETTTIILRQFSGMSKALWGSEHPLSRIYEQFDKIYQSDFEDVFIRCVEIVASYFESSFGPLHLSTLYSRIDLILVGTQNRIPKFQRLLREYENALRPEDVRVRQIRRWLAEECFGEGFYDDAMSLSQMNIAQYQDQSSMNIGPDDYSYNLSILAACQHALGEVDLGIATLHQAIDVSISQWGTQDTQARYWLLTLEDWYSEQGLSDSATMARELSLIALKSMDVD